MALEPLPPSFAQAREALHHLAASVVSPARARVTGRIGLRPTAGGFDTPPFGDGQRVRVDGAELVFENPDGERRDPIDVDAAGARALGEFYAFAGDVLEELREADEASKIQLWPEHFDVAFEAGSESEGRRANYGGSPGDEHHPEPYLYVGPWTGPPEGELWNAVGFPGAELGYAELVAAHDQRAAALEFFRARMAALGGHAPRSRPSAQQ